MECVATIMVKERGRKQKTARQWKRNEKTLKCDKQRL
jgi:hypothetical protein